jgi:hypothetical protein
MPGGKAMLASIGPRSKEARAQQLRLELEDVLKRLPGPDDEAGLSVLLPLADYARYTRDTFGPFETIATETKSEIARQLLAQARESFERDRGQGYAYFILSALYESAGLPGEDADFVKASCARHVLTALEAKRSRETGG